MKVELFELKEARTCGAVAAPLGAPAFLPGWTTWPRGRSKSLQTLLQAKKQCKDPYAYFPSPNSMRFAAKSKNIMEATSPIPCRILKFPVSKGAPAEATNNATATRLENSAYAFRCVFFNRAFAIWFQSAFKQFSCQDLQAWAAPKSVERFDTMSRFATRAVTAFCATLMFFSATSIAPAHAEVTVDPTSGIRLQYVISGGGGSVPATPAPGDVQLLNVMFQPVAGIAASLPTAQAELGWLYTFLPALFGPGGNGPVVALRILLEGFFNGDLSTNPPPPAPLMRSGTTVVLEARTGASPNLASTRVGNPQEIAITAAGETVAPVTFSGLPPGPGDYYIVATHKASAAAPAGPNHLPVISSGLVHIDPALPVNTLNFSFPGPRIEAFTPAGASSAMREAQVGGANHYFLRAGDMAADKVISLGDYTVWDGIYRPGLADPVGDLSGDGLTHLADYTIWYASYNTLPASQQRHSYVPDIP